MLKKFQIDKIFYILKKNNLRKLILISFLTIITATLEVIGIGMLIPLLGMFVNNSIPDYLNFDFLQKNISYSLLIVLLGFTLIQLFKFVSSFLLLIKKTNFHWNLNGQISTMILNNYLNKNILFFSKVRSSEIIQMIRGEASMFSTGVIHPLLELVIELVLFVCVSIFLFYYNFKISFFLVLFFLILGFLWQKYFNKYLKDIGMKRQLHARRTIEKIQNGIGNIREIILYGLKDIFTKEHDHHNYKFINSVKSKEIIIAFPRLFLEFLSFVILLIIFITLNIENTDLKEIIITISIYVFAIIRIAPAVNKIVKSVQNLKYNNVVIDKIYHHQLEADNFKKEQKIELSNFKDKFEFKNYQLKNVSFTYPETDKEILTKINMNFTKGEKIGIIGSTGSGKTTLVNIIANLVEVSEGKVLLNNDDVEKNVRAFQKNIGYISPDTFLVDKSILFNITFKNNDKVNHNELMKIIEIVELKNFLSKLPYGLDTNVGEEGTRFSLGQRQRIGIARAIFQDPQILILDEATSFLDEDTEKSILERIFNKMQSKTILTVSHRKNPLKFCNTIYEIKDQKLIKI